MKQQIPARILFIPPVISSVVLGAAAGLIGFGLSVGDTPEVAREVFSITTGAGMIVGFFWGSIVWTDKLIDAVQPGRKIQFNTYAQTVSRPEALGPRPVRIELHNKNSGFLNVDYLDLPADIQLKQLIEIGKMLVSTEYAFSHALSGKYQPLNRSQFEALRDLLIARGLARWNNSNARNQGVMLLPAGKSLFRQLATYQEGRLPKLLSVLG